MGRLMDVLGGGLETCAQWPSATAGLSDGDTSRDFSVYIGLNLKIVIFN